MRKIGLILCAIGVIFLFVANMASATLLYFDPTDRPYSIGDTLYYDLYADIDEDDAIMGFGFDLSFDGGATFISAPGDSGSCLTFDSFTVNSRLFEGWDPMDPISAGNLFGNDIDTIAGGVPFEAPDVYGTGIRLGTFEFTAHALGTETFMLDADDLGPFGTEGLVQGKISGVGFMPNRPSATAHSVPEPYAWLLLLIILPGLIRKRVKD